MMSVEAASQNIKAAEKGDQKNVRLAATLANLGVRVWGVESIS